MSHLDLVVGSVTIRCSGVNSLMLTPLAHVMARESISQRMRWTQAYPFRSSTAKRAFISSSVGMLDIRSFTILPEAVKVRISSFSSRPNPLRSAITSSTDLGASLISMLMQPPNKSIGSRLCWNHSRKAGFLMYTTDERKDLCQTTANKPQKVNQSYLPYCFFPLFWSYSSHFLLS